MKIDVKGFLTGAKNAAKKHSPEMLLVMGIGAGIAAAIVACKNTLKTPEIKEKKEQDMKDIHEKEEKNELTEKEVRKETAKVYIRTGMAYAKLYSVAIGLGIVSIALVSSGFGILNRRVANLSAAVGSLITESNRIQQEIEERFGKDVADEIRNGVKTVEADVENPDGTVEKKDIKVTSGGLFTVFYDKGTSSYAQGIREYDEMFLKAQQNYACDLLNANKSLTLNKVLENLGYDMEKMKNTNPRLFKASMVCGWIKEKDNQIGDNYVNFNIQEGSRMFDDGIVRPTWILSFNVDGNIYDRI